MPWNVGAAAFLRNLTQLGVSWCEALAQSQISMPWTATDPQDHVGGCAPHNPNATSPRPADTRQGARPSESVNRMRTTQLVRTYSASQLLLVGRKGPRKENSKICKWPFAGVSTCAGTAADVGARGVTPPPVHACAHWPGLGLFTWLSPGRSPSAGYSLRGVLRWAIR